MAVQFILIPPAESKSGHSSLQCKNNGSTFSVADAHFLVTLCTGLIKHRVSKMSHLWLAIILTYTVRLVHCVCNTVQLRQRSRLIQHLS